MNSRKNNRLEFYDYSQNGAYFVTICAKDKQKIFWNNQQCSVGAVSGRPQDKQKIFWNEQPYFVGDGAHDVPQIRLSVYGKIVNDEIIKSNEIYNYIKVEKYVIMPNHIHLIINVQNVDRGTSRAPSRTNEIIPSFISMLKRFTNKKCGEKIWQRSFHDHVIRNQADYNRIWEYVDTNAIKWESDCYYN